MSERSDRELEVMEYLLERGDELRARQGIQKARKATNQLAVQEQFLERYEEVASRIFNGKIDPLKRPPKLHPKERELSLVLSDTHYGADLDPRVVPFKYGTVEEARRSAAVFVQTADYKRQYRKETALNVHLLGDIIQGQLHDPRDGAPLAEQVARAQHILIHGIRYLAAEFGQVNVHCATGNHGRNGSRHKNRAVNQKWDSYETGIYTGLKLALQNLPNVKVEIPRAPYYTVQIFDKVGFFTHGDSVFNPGYPGKAIDTGSISKQINQWNASGKHFDLFVVGHVHVGSLTHLSGAVFMSNGCLIPTDEYALSIGITDTTCGQYLFESVPGHIVGDSRFIRVDDSIDKDKSLDKVIPPFEDF